MTTSPHSPGPGPGAAWSRRRWLQAASASTAIAGLGLGCTATLAQVRVEITGVGATQIPVALAPFRDETVTGVALSAVIRANLERSGAFRVIAVPPGLDERSTPDLAAFRGQGTDALVAGSATRLADGSVDVRMRLWDSVRGTELAGQGSLVLPADLRLAAHRLSDLIHEKLTGQRGVFATRIAYVLRTGRRFTLHVTDPDGEGGQIALASPEPIISPAWSPDGKRLAYVSFESQKAVVWVQDVASGSRRVLADFRGSNSAPAWSPDGRRLVATLSRDGNSQLYLINADGSGGPQRLTASTAIDTEAVWSPDGASVYFVSDRGGGPQVYRVPSGGGAVERITFQGDYNISPAISPDGRQLAYVSRQAGAFRLMLLDLVGGTPLPLTDTRDDESPSFAPNGRLIVYATRSGGGDVLMTTTLDGKIKTRLLASGADMREPAWGPYGR